MQIPQDGNLISDNNRIIENRNLVHTLYAGSKTQIKLNLLAYQQGVGSLSINWDIEAEPSIRYARLVFQLIIILNIRNNGL